MNMSNNSNASKSSVSSLAASPYPGEYPHRVNPPDTVYDQYQQQQKQHQEHYHYQPYRKLYRSTTNKWLGGVCSGLAKYYNWDPVLVRIIWVVVTLFSAGVGIIGYILFWLFVDKEPTQFIETRQYSTREMNGSVHVHHHYRPAD